MAIEVNGVTLPDIPVVEGYPYAVIVLMEANFDGEFVSIYGVTYCSDRMYYEHLLSGGDVVGSDEWLIRPRTSTAYQCAYDGENNCWGEATEVVDDDIMPLGEYSMQGYTTTYTLLWANHDILTASKNSDLNIVATDEIYFPSSVVAEPEYGKIRRAIIRGASNAVRRKTGRTDKFPPEQLEYEIDSIVTADNLSRRLIQKNICGEYYDAEIEAVESNVFSYSVALTSINLPNIKSLGSSALRECLNLSEVAAPNLETMGGEVFYGCPKLRHICFPKLKSMGVRGFAQCLSLAKADFSSLTSIGEYAFSSDAALTTLIFRMGNILPFTAGAINGTPIASGSGYIYVPSSLVSSYKVATGWSTYAAQFRAIEDYPNICGG